ncbi:hypothetical protein PSUM_07265 [Pseudomonas umsongensis]|uniref:Uncharacterized protein n=1 Tax=Pseudomonas umsongensis TaxID=198618 RepID=A0ABX4E2H6_9PSED|nr:hypothetical protein PSUM_07265 [Pseudomonas umsongensis]
MIFLPHHGGLCRSEHAPGGVPTKNLRAPRGVRLPASSLTSIVGTPPGACSLLRASPSDSP